ncbi:MAG: metal ABC transporter permease [Lentisphaerae bacterium]|nr:metal ABC transporter permease [Lentisphaerota bacterium]
MQFFSDLPLYPFLQYAVVASLMAAIAAGVVGTFVVVRRTTYTAAAVSHCVLAGLGLARLLQRRFDINWFTPMTGALLTAIAVALILSRMSERGGQRRDAVLSVLWSVGMALGITFMALTPGYQEDLGAYLLGSILLVGTPDLILMALLNILVLTTVILFYNRLLCVAFNEEVARLRGLRVGFYETALQLLTALTVVLLVQVAGIVLAVALLTLPAATASLLTRRLNTMIWLAVALALIVSVGGLALSYGPELPPGATIVELAAVLYITALAAVKVKRRVRGAS